MLRALFKIPRGVYYGIKYWRPKRTWCRDDMHTERDPAKQIPRGKIYINRTTGTQ